MPRTISANLQTLVASNTAHTVMLLDLVAGATTKRFAGRTLTFEGNSYEPRLTLAGSITHRRSLQLDSAVAGIENASLFFTDLLKAITLEGASAKLRRLYLDVWETITVFEGIVSTCRVERGSAQITITSRLDPSATRVPQRFYNGPDFEALTRAVAATVPPPPPPDPLAANSDFGSEMDPFWEDYQI